MPSRARIWIPPNIGVVIQRLLVIKLSSILSFPQSHLQDECHMFTTKVWVIFFYTCETCCKPVKLFVKATERIFPGISIFSICEPCQRPPVWPCLKLDLSTVVMQVENGSYMQVAELHWITTTANFEIGHEYIKKQQSKRLLPDLKVVTAHFTATLQDSS